MKFPRVTVLMVVLFLVSIGPAVAGSQPPPLGLPGGSGEQEPFIDHWGPASLAAIPATSTSVPIGQPGTVYSYRRTYGETQAPYIADEQHLNRPNGLFIDGSNALYVVEEAGHRLVKYNSSGASVLTIGQAGVGFSWGDLLATPKSVAVDASGNIWVTISDAVKEFDAAGNLIQTLPEDDPWNSGSDNSHFNQPRGIAFDSAGRLFVADRYNHRVQVYTVSGDSLIYEATIGVTGEPGSDNAHFNGPAEIVVDGSDWLYVADVENFRVQRCTFSGTWTCSTFHGTGTAGGAANQLSWAYGLGRDVAGNTIFIADSGNGRIKRCNTSGACSIPITGANWPADVAVDTSGAIFVSSYFDSIVRRYSSSGGFLGVFAGAEGVPYVTDDQHYNAPWGVAVAPDGSTYIAESIGYRLIKLNRDGVPQWTVGQPGIYGDDNAHFGNWWAGPEGNLAVDDAGRVYVPDTGNHRIQIFNADGSFYRSFGQYGTGNYPSSDGFWGHWR